ncbi:hypothetical protein FH972_002243 [Carpinus fangiana]|uniref:Uncharacterized protein n=1 Tax=Carpinus fangiana TaxID=176857 RepID=A0A5N6QEM0_9ROSI|nr:hypothetical protein FH972_002243 [Carpinus fangiana]
MASVSPTIGPPPAMDLVVCSLHRRSSLASSTITFSILDVDSKPHSFPRGVPCEPECLCLTDVLEGPVHGSDSVVCNLSKGNIVAVPKPTSPVIVVFA